MTEITITVHVKENSWSAPQEFTAVLPFTPGYQKVCDGIHVKLDAGCAVILANAESHRNAAVETERRDALKALETLAGAHYPTPAEGYGSNSSWAISDLCRLVKNQLVEIGELERRKSESMDRTDEALTLAEGFKQERDQLSDRLYQVNVTLQSNKTALEMQSIEDAAKRVIRELSESNRREADNLSATAKISLLLEQTRQERDQLRNNAEDLGALCGMPAFEYIKELRRRVKTLKDALGKFADGVFSPQVRRMAKQSLAAKEPRREN